jgi:hypothetical protein
MLWVLHNICDPSRPSIDPQTAWIAIQTILKPWSYWASPKHPWRFFRLLCVGTHLVASGTCIHCLPEVHVSFKNVTLPQLFIQLDVEYIGRWVHCSYPNWQTYHQAYRGRKSWSIGTDPRGQILTTFSTSPLSSYQHTVTIHNLLNNKSQSNAPFLTHSVLVNAQYSDK